MKHPRTGKVAKVALDIPSGKMIFNDSLREGFNIEKRFNFNGCFGTFKSILAHGKIGCFHGYCGNSCPTITKKGNKLYIGHDHYPKDDEGMSDYDNPDETLPGESVGGICTDLWWYSFADYDLAKSKGMNVDNYDYVDVEPGRYVLTHYMDEYFGHKTKCEIYATIEKSDEEFSNEGIFPEDGIVEQLYELIPEELVTKKLNKDGERSDFISIDSHYEDTGKKDKDGFKVHKYVGYKVWGSIRKTNKYFKAIVTPDDISDPELVMLLCLTNLIFKIDAQKRHDDLMAMLDTYPKHPDCTPKQKKEKKAMWDELMEMSLSSLDSLDSL